MNFLGWEEKKHFAGKEKNILYIVHIIHGRASLVKKKNHHHAKHESSRQTEAWKWYITGLRGRDVHEILVSLSLLVMQHIALQSACCDLLLLLMGNITLHVWMIRMIRTHCIKCNNEKVIFYSSIYSAILIRNMRCSCDVLHVVYVV